MAAWMGNKGEWCGGSCSYSGAALGFYGVDGGMPRRSYSCPRGAHRAAWMPTG